jgi:hypothetical protein
MYSRHVVYTLWSPSRNTGEFPQDLIFFTRLSSRFPVSEEHLMGPPRIFVSWFGGASTSKAICACLSSKLCKNHVSMSVCRDLPRRYATCMAGNLCCAPVGRIIVNPVMIPVVLLFLPVFSLALLLLGLTPLCLYHLMLYQPGVRMTATAPEGLLRLQG